MFKMLRFQLFLLIEGTKKRVKIRVAVNAAVFEFESGFRSRSTIQNFNKLSVERIFVSVAKHELIRTNNYMETKKNSKAF